MIEVNDLLGTVTMSLEDYEIMRDRQNKFIKDQKNTEEIFAKELSEFEKDKLLFEKGMFRKEIECSRTSCTYNYNGDLSPGTGFDENIKTVTWMGKEDVEKDIRVELEKEKQDIINKLKWFSILEFRRWRKNNR